MEKNTVVLDLARYHEFDDLEKALIGKKIIEITTGTMYSNGYNHSYRTRKFFDSEEINKDILEINEQLGEEIKRSDSEYARVKHELKEKFIY